MRTSQWVKADEEAKGHEKDGKDNDDKPDHQATEDAKDTEDKEDKEPKGTYMDQGQGLEEHK